MASYINYNLGKTVTNEGAQKNKTTTGPRTDTTTVGSRTDTSHSSQSSSTNAQANSALDRAYNTKAQLGTAGSLGYKPDQLDQDRLLSLYNNAAQTQYKGDLQALDASRREYGSALRSAQDNYLNAMREANASAIASGAARGTQAANELSTMLGLQQESIQGATDLANQRAQAGMDYAKALAKAQIDAEDTVYNRQKSVVDQLLQQYASDSDVLGMLNYGALGDYMAGNVSTTTDSTNVTGSQTTTNKTGKQTTSEKLGKKKTKSKTTKK